ncbi:uncharacterized protein VTP21DRAFT_3103 [Calcarisporiella thermophila]|uniref:uncharacterized protein n=1 Tax=Calcarisporiella thermophila TaxID=911321 RepID=UPI003741F6C6
MFQQPFPLKEGPANTGSKQIERNLNIHLICPDCRNPVPNLVEEFASGDTVCADCGLVLGDRVIDTRSEWRTFADDEGDDPSRVGAAANPLLDGSQLDTVIGQRDGGTGASRLLNKVHSRSMSQRGERQLIQAYKDIQAMCDSISLSRTVADTAKQLYKRVEDEKLLRGKSPDAIIAACIFIACRQENVGRTFKEICKLTRVSKRDIGRCYKLLQEKFKTNTTVQNSEDLMARFCSHLALPVFVQRAGVELVRRVKDQGTLAGKSPISVAAACIYMVSALLGMTKSPKDIAEVAGVSELTIRNAYKYLYNAREKLVGTEPLVSGRSYAIDPDDLPTP